MAGRVLLQRILEKGTDHSQTNHNIVTRPKMDMILSGPYPVYERSTFS